MRQPIASVVIPAFHVEPYLETCVRSAMSQTLRDIEIIVIDDASADGTRRVLHDLAREDPRIVPVLLDRNVGVCAARNLGFDRARGDWIAVLDGDDWMAPNRLAQMVSAARRFDADWLADDLYLVREGASGPIARLLDAEPPGARLIDPAHFVERDLPERLGYGLLKPLFRRAFLERHSIQYRLGFERFEDFLIDVECFAAGARTVLLNEPLYFYLLREGSLTTLNSVLTLNGMIATSDRALECVDRLRKPHLHAALLLRERRIRRALRYHKVVAPLRARNLVETILSIVRDPMILPHLSSEFASKALLKVRGHDPIDYVLLPGARGARTLRPVDRVALL